ncbi:FMN-linked oxidoreductase [Epithele typhae]|uniref:FMN-linked oxidoreductase n=1 Tax=Epithele typhae TaxID=378194 RepID=UPI002008BBED|nr:FMN-linked oxidoreductase [Epithele typhae]KAH9925861.1 FMN-linked oxidoreductase [Epithele typhae]
MPAATPASHSLDLSRIAAPMVGQSDLPFRLLVRRYGASLAYTQMLLPDRLLSDPDYLAFHTRGLREGDDRPVVVQLCGNDPETVVRAARTVVHRADAIVDGGRRADLNLGCPQDAAREAHYGGYLLGQKDWPLVESIVSALSHSLPVPVSCKVRLTPDPAHTPMLGARLEAAGASWLTLHARQVSARRRRQGAADLAYVGALRSAVHVPVVSNGNVRTWEDIGRNLEETKADGVMVGEELLANPCLFADKVPDPVKISLEYLALVEEHPETATMQTVQMHVRHFIEKKCGRRPWFTKFRMALARTETPADIVRLLRVRVQRWRGLPPLEHDRWSSDSKDDDDEHEDGPREEAEDLSGLGLWDL